MERENKESENIESEIPEWKRRTEQHGDAEQVLMLVKLVHTYRNQACESCVRGNAWNTFPRVSSTSTSASPNIYIYIYHLFINLFLVLIHKIKLSTSIAKIKVCNCILLYFALWILCRCYLSILGGNICLILQLA